MTPADAVEKIKSYAVRDINFQPKYDVENGYSAWKFGDLCRRISYEEAHSITERMLQWEVAPADCLLFTTYRAFQEAEKSTL